MLTLGTERTKGLLSVEEKHRRALILDSDVNDATRSDPAHTASLQHETITAQRAQNGMTFQQLM